MRPIVTTAVALVVVMGSVLSARAAAPLRDEDLDHTTAAGEAKPGQPEPETPARPGPPDLRSRYIDGRAKPDEPVAPIPAQQLLPLGPVPLLDPFSALRPNR